MSSAVAPEGSTGLLTDIGWAGSNWSFILLAKSQGPQAAKDGCAAALSTIGVVDALMLSFAFPAIWNPPDLLLSDDYHYLLRAWFWLAFLSVWSAMVSILLTILMLAYMMPVAEDGVIRFLTRNHLTFTLAAGGFMICVLCQAGALIVSVRSYMEPQDFWPALSLMVAALGALIIHFAISEMNSQTMNREVYEEWEEKNKRGGTTAKTKNKPQETGNGDGAAA